MSIFDELRNDKEIQELKKVYIEKYGKNLPYHWDCFKDIEDYKNYLRKKCMMYKENDNLDVAEIERYRKMSQEERDKLIAEKENEILAEIHKSKETSK